MNRNLSDVEIATKTFPARAFTQTNVMTGVPGPDKLKAEKAKKSPLWAHVESLWYRFEAFQQNNFLELHLEEFTQNNG